VQSTSCVYSSCKYVWLANAKTLDKRQTRAVVREGAPRRQLLQYLTHYLVSSGREPEVGGEY